MQDIIHVQVEGEKNEKFMDNIKAHKVKISSRHFCTAVALFRRFIACDYGFFLLHSVTHRYANNERQMDLNLIFSAISTPSAARARAVRLARMNSSYLTFILSHSSLLSCLIGFKRVLTNREIHGISSVFFAVSVDFTMPTNR